MTDLIQSIDLLTTASFQLLFGKFYSYFSIKWVYLIAIGIFEIGSLICGAAPNSVALIIGRAVAGLGSAGIFSGALIIIVYSAPLVKRPAYSGLIGAMYGVASVAGPLLGGGMYTFHPHTLDIHSPPFSRMSIIDHYLLTLNLSFY